MNHYFNEKISLIMSLLIINNYLLLSLNLPQIITKINFLVFLLFVLIFYSKNFSENIFLKISFLFIIFISLGVVTDGWDARSIWLFHAKRIFYENSIFSIADNYASFSHNAYPTLAPAFAASNAAMEPAGPPPTTTIFTNINPQIKSLKSKCQLTYKLESKTI